MVANNYNKCNEDFKKSSTREAKRDSISIVIREIDRK